MSKPQIRCAVYTRKSSEEGLEQSFNSLEAQREACIAYIHSQKHEGWVAIRQGYDDGGFSGGNMERPALIRLLDDIRADKVDIVVVYKVDRLTRSLSDFAKIIEVFDSQQVSFVSVTQQFNTTTSMGRLTLNVLLSFAQFERELTGERIRDKIAASKKKGMWMGGVVPVGYDAVDHRLVVKQSEAETVREIFRQYVRLGSVQKLKQYLEHKQIRSKVRIGSDGRTYGGAAYSRGALYKLLNNRIYIGKIVHRGQGYAGQHEPIVPEKLWKQVTARLEINNRAHRTGTPHSRSSLLTGLLRDTGGVRLTPTHAVKNGKRYHYYTSQAVIQKQGEQPEICRYPARELDALVAAQIQKLLGSIDKYLTNGNSTPELDLAAQRATRLAEQWPKMNSSRQNDLIRDVVKTVTMGQKKLWIEIDKVRLVTKLLGHSPELFSATDKLNKAIKLTADFEPVRRGAELRIYTPGNSIGHSPVPSLVRAVARARIWYEQLISGEVTSVRELAQQNGFKCRYVRQVLRAATLSPEVMGAILSGNHANHVTTRRLQRDLPLAWEEQQCELLV